MFIVNVVATRASLPVGSPRPSSRTGDAVAFSGPLALPVCSSVSAARSCADAGPFTNGSNIVCVAVVDLAGVERREDRVVHVGLGRLQQGAPQRRLDLRGRARVLHVDLADHERQRRGLGRGSRWPCWRSRASSCPSRRRSRGVRPRAQRSRPRRRRSVAVRRFRDWVIWEGTTIPACHAAHLLFGISERELAVALRKFVDRLTKPTEQVDREQLAAVVLGPWCSRRSTRS